MTGNRKGVSFTLTIVVTGVILLMTALSIITLGGSSIQSFFTTITGEQQEAIEQSEIRDACNDLARTINQEYCGQYVQDDCTDPQATRDPDTHPQTGTESGCALSSYYDAADGDFEVDIQGNTYDCQTEGYIGTRCPAG